MPAVGEEKKGALVIVPQTRVLFIAYVLLGVAIAITALSTPVPLAGSWFQILYFIAAAILSLYVVNCTVLGNCKTFAWIMAYVYLVVAFTLAMMLIPMLYRRTK